jgi:hypothetical protein
MNLPDSREQQRQRLQAKEMEDPEYASLVAVLGRKNSQNARHIRTAEKFGLFCFLTMDFRLIETLAAQRNSPRIRALKTSIMTPASRSHPHRAAYSELYRCKLSGEKRSCVA